MKRVVIILFTIVVQMCAVEQNSSQPLDIDKEIEKIMHAPPAERRKLMNDLKRKIFKLNIDLQSTHLLNLQRIINSRPTNRMHK